MSFNFESGSYVLTPDSYRVLDIAVKQRMAYPEVKVEIAESNLLTLRVTDKGDIYWNSGIESPAKIEFKDLRKFLVERNRENPKLVTLVKVAREGKYRMMVDIMDELNLAEITRFSLAPLTDADKELVAKVQS